MKTDAQMCQQFEASVSFLFAAILRMTDTVCFCHHDSVQGTFKLRKACFIKGIVDILSLPSVVYDSCLDQYLHIVGQRRLCDMERLKDFAGAQFPAGKHINNAQTLRVGNRL